MGAVLQFTPRRAGRSGGGGGSEPLTPEMIRAEIECGVQAALGAVDRLVNLLDRMDLNGGGDAGPVSGGADGHTCQIIPWLRGGGGGCAATALDPALPDVRGPRRRRPRRTPEPSPTIPTARSTHKRRPRRRRASR